MSSYCLGVGSGEQTLWDIMIPKTGCEIAGREGTARLYLYTNGSFTRMFKIRNSKCLKRRVPVRQLRNLLLLYAWFYLFCVTRKPLLSIVKWRRSEERCKKQPYLLNFIGCLYYSLPFRTLLKLRFIALIILILVLAVK
jgi:hypothetical protein